MAMAGFSFAVHSLPDPSPASPSPSLLLLLPRFRATRCTCPSFPSASSSSSSSSSPSGSSDSSNSIIVRPSNRRLAIARTPLLLAFLLLPPPPPPPIPPPPALHFLGEPKPVFAAVAPSDGTSKESGVISSQKEKGSRSVFADRVQEAILWLEKGKEAQARGDFRQALLWYTQVVEKHGDLALSEYARVGRAISLYEVGDKEDAFIEMEDVSISLKGYPEVHAALAAALYADKHSPVAAEQQFTIATLLDPNYIDLSYVKDTKHWPPNLLMSFERFINFK